MTRQERADMALRDYWSDRDARRNGAALARGLLAALRCLTLAMLADAAVAVGIVFMPMWAPTIWAFARAIVGG